MTKINWAYCQKNSDSILASGLNLLQEDTIEDFDSEFSKDYGNYLISDKSKEWNYIGEAKNLSKRLKQHSKEETSTFYKNYKKLEKDFCNYPKGLKISQFEVRTINTKIGRKELEEFGIVNIPAVLNKFQKRKRNRFKQKVDTEIWNGTQSNFHSILEQEEKKLMGLKSYNWFQPQIPSTAGLYWVENKSKGLIYIGESSNIYERYGTHSRDTYFSALRRHIGEKILGFNLQTINNRKRYFSKSENDEITTFLKECIIKPFSINYGRYELEEYLIRKYNPLLNRKGK